MAPGRWRLHIYLALSLIPLLVRAGHRAYKTQKDGIASLDTANSCYNSNSDDHSYGKEFIVRIKTYLKIPPILVPCQPDDGGWLIIMRRYDGRLDFESAWEEYAEGFGDILSEFWLGNRNLHAMTSTNVYKLRIDMTNWEGRTFYAECRSFRVRSESTNFMLNIGTHVNSSTAQDSISVGVFSNSAHQNGMAFSTPDRDNDRYNGNCATERKAGWWFHACQQATPTGIYRAPSYRGHLAMRWHSVDSQRSLKEMTLKVKRVA